MFTVFSVLSLASGVAITTAVYSVVETLMLADLGISEPDRAAFVVTPISGRMQFGSLSDVDFEQLKSTQRSFSSLSAAVAITPAVSASSNAEVLSAEAIEETYFPTLGVNAGYGRLIHTGDDGARVAVLSDEFWRSDFAADPKVVGRTIRINEQAFEVIGIAPATYRGLFGAFRATSVCSPWRRAAAPIQTICASRSSARRRAPGAGNHTDDGIRGAGDHSGSPRPGTAAT
jgi:hypothetical protein